MPKSESSSDLEQSAAESSQRRDSEDLGSERSEKEPLRSGQFEQSIVEPPPLDTPENPYPEGLVGLLSRVTPDSFEVNRALEDLRLMIERTVRREVGWLARVISAKLEASETKSEARFKASEAKLEAREAKLEAREAKSEAKSEAREAKSEARFAAIESRLESLESQFRMVRWLLGLIFAMLTAILVLLLSESRSPTPLPPPRGAAVQAPAETETTQPPSDMPVRETSELASPTGNSDGSEAPADHTVP